MSVDPDPNPSSSREEKKNPRQRQKHVLVSPEAKRSRLPSSLPVWGETRTEWVHSQSNFYHKFFLPPLASPAHSFSGTSSSARAFLKLASASSRSHREANGGRPDLHLLGRMGRPAAPPLPGGERRCVSPASALLSSMRVRAAAAAARGGSTFGTRTGGARYGERKLLLVVMAVVV